MKINGIQILKEDLIPEKLVEGKKYHVNWAKRGCIWIFKGYNVSGMAILETPRTHRKIHSSPNSLIHINSDALKAARKRLKQ